MKKKLLGKLLSLTLSAALLTTGFSAPVYAAETELEFTENEEIIDIEVEEPSAEDIAEDVSEEVPSEETDSEEAPIEDEITVDEEADEAAGETSEEEVVEAADEASEEASDEASEDLSEEEFAEETKEPSEAASEDDVIDAKDADIKVTSEDTEVKGTYNLKFNAGIPAGCLQKNLSGYTDGQIVTTEVGEPIVLSGDEFQLPGYVLVGWTYTNAKGKTVRVAKPYATIPALTDKEGETFEFTPLWKLGTYTITYDFNGGTSKLKNRVIYKLDSATVNKQPLFNYVADGDDFAINTRNPEVTRDGFEFDGWDGEYAEEKYYGDTTFRNMTLRAKWKANSYIVKLDGNGGTVYGSVGYSFKATAEDDLSGWTAVRDGYTHKGWKAKVKGKDRIFKVTDSIPLKNLDRSASGVYELTAVWEVNRYSLSYDLNGGTLAKGPKVFKTDDETTIPDPIKPGYKFSGWQVKLFENDKDEGKLVSAEVAGYMKDGKLTSIARDNLTLYAEWEILNYNITFKNSDGSDLVGDDGAVVEVPSYNGVWYTDSLDFAAAATMIEESGALGNKKSIAGFAKTSGARKPDYKLNTKYTKILPSTYNGEGTDVPVTLYVVPQEKVYRITYQLSGGDVKGATYSYTDKNVINDLPIRAVASKKGWKFLGWATTEEYSDYVVRDSKGYVTAIKEGSDSNVVLIAVYGDVNMYTITLLPGAADVKDGKGKLIDVREGVQYKDGSTTTFSYGDYGHTLFAAGENWTRPGYTFGGFYTDVKYTKYAFYAGELGSGKDSNVKVYARWYPTTQKITFDQTAVIYRDKVSYKASQSTMKTTFGSVERVAFGTKVIVPKNLKVNGYIFKGWKIDGKLSDDSGIEYNDSGFVKRINKNNRFDVKLIPVFEELSYQIYVNPNGGKYKDSAAKALIDSKVYYTQTLEDVYEDIATYTTRTGFNFNCVSTGKDSRGSILHTRRYSGGSIEEYFDYGLGKKKDQAVVLNVVWDKVNPATPTPTKSSIRINGDTLSLGSNYWPSAGSSRIVFEYSTKADFSKNVKSYTWEGVAKDIYGNVVYPSVKVTAGKNYYVRARQEVMDSTGEYFAGAWSSPVMATK